MSWNYRVLRRVVRNGFAEPEEEFAIHEVFYDSRGRPESCTADPIPLSASTSAELKRELRFYARALRMPILEYAIFERRAREAAKKAKKRASAKPPLKCAHDGRPPNPIPGIEEVTRRASPSKERKRPKDAPFRA